MPEKSEVLEACSIVNLMKDLEDRGIVEEVKDVNLKNRIERAVHPVLRPVEKAMLVQPRERGLPPVFRFKFINTIWIVKDLDRFRAVLRTILLPGRLAGRILVPEEFERKRTALAQII